MSLDICVTFDESIEKIYDLRVGTTSADDGAPHERPHKPLLLLSIIEMIDNGEATPDRIPWCQSLRQYFTDNFEIVRKHDDNNTPENPFYYLNSDGIWKSWTASPSGPIPLSNTPRVADIGTVYGSFINGFDLIVANPIMRNNLKQAIVSRYFPQHAAQLLIRQEKPTQKASEDEEEFGRSPAFRRKILDIYDHQCSACGLRIKLNQGTNISFVDAAHLIPFSESQNDHPTNGISLCKNHHWAMDRNLIAPCSDHTWHAANFLDPRRSSGEQELINLAGKPLLLPSDPAFYPSETSLEWRCNRLV